MKHPVGRRESKPTGNGFARSIEYAAASIVRGVSNVWGDYVYLVDVKADNERLGYDNARLRENVHRLERGEVENRELNGCFSCARRPPATR